jgi:hypothetical protein
MNSADLAGTMSRRNGAAVDDDRTGYPPTVFLMANEFATGGTEKQFIILARALQRA